MIVSVRKPGVPFGRLWLPIPSVVVYLAAWVVKVWLASGRRRPGEEEGKSGIDVRRMAPHVTKLAWALLWSGSYVLCDVKVPEEGVRVKISVI